MLRASLETLFQLHAVWKSPCVVSPIIEAHRADQRTVVDRALRWKSDRLRDALEKGISAEELKTLQASKVPGVNLYQMAVAGRHGGLVPALVYPAKFSR